MPQLEDISALPHDAVELLEAVGYLDVHDLVTADLAELVVELNKANQALEIMRETPSEETVRQWMDIASANNHQQPAPQQETSAPVEPVEVDAGTEYQEEDLGDAEAGSGQGSDRHAFDIDPSLVNFEEDPEVQEMLQVSPEALPLHPSLIRRHKLAVADIPEGILLTQCQGEVEINVVTTDRLARAQRREAELKRTGLMVSRIRSFDEADSDDHHVKPLDKGKPKDVVSVSADLNQGVKPESKFFVRGVLHPDPYGVRMSAAFAILVQLMLIATILGVPALLVHEALSGESMLWWVVGICSGLVVSALCYLFWGLSARCRVCGQRQFAPKKCLKNRKAHHIPVIGYIFPTAIHAIFFKWFYCTYCGTAVRLKK